MLVELYDVARLMRTRFDRWARTYGMTRAQGIILARLSTGVDTLVFLMGVERLAQTVARLVEHGRAATTPVAVVEWGTLPRQRVVTATLATIVDEVARAGIGAPAVTVVGEVARLRDELRWFDAWPLFGKRVLVTRTRQQASELSRALAAQGADAIELPTIEIVESYDPRAVAAAIENLRTSGYGWVIFTSTNAVDEFMRHLREAGLDVRAFGRAQIAAMGSGTARSLATHGLRADVSPERHIAEGLLNALSSRVMRGQRVLLPRAEGARPQIVDGLEARGARVDELTLYRSAVPTSVDGYGLRQCGR